MTDEEAAATLRGLLEDGDAELMEEEITAVQIAIARLTGQDGMGEFATGEPE